MTIEFERDLLPLLGRGLDDRALNETVRHLGEEPRVDVIGDETYFKYVASGVALAFGADERLRTVFLHSAGHDGYSESVVPPPKGIQWRMERSAVIAMLGEPARSGRGGSIEGLGPVPPWDLYIYDDFAMNVQYARDSPRAVLITLMHPNVVPRLTQS
jgi:hypothetical protein